MHPDRALDRPRDLAIAAFLVLALSLVILGGATGFRWLSASWSTACHRLLHAPRPPDFAAPWRLTNLQTATHCLTRRP